MNTRELEELLDENCKMLNDKLSDVENRVSSEKLKKELEQYKKVTWNKTQNSLNNFIDVVKSPIHIGLLGKYSHGKTALINSIFNLSNEEELPTGEQIVTSKISKLSFDSTTYEIKTSEILTTGEVVDIGFEDMKSVVTSGDQSAINYIDIVFPTKGDFAKAFERNNIHIIDMPGLGGTYFKDTHTTTQYLDNLDFLIVAIKANEIKQASSLLDLYLNRLNVPVIPVITFSDNIKDYSDYTDCQNDDEYINKARNLIKEYIPSMKNLKDLMLVSANTKDENGRIKEGLNINNLQTLIIGYVEKKEFAIAKIKKEPAVVHQRKIKEIKLKKTELDRELKKAEEDLVNRISNALPMLKKENSKIQTFGDFYDKNKRIQQTKKDFKNSIKDIRKSFDNECNNNILNINNIATSVQSFMEDVKKYEDDMSKGLEKSLKAIEDESHPFLERILEETNGYIDKIILDKEPKAELKDNLDEKLQDIVFKTEKKDLSFRKILDTELAEKNKRLGLRTLSDTVKDPGTLLPTLAGGGAMVGGYMLTSVSGVLGGIAGAAALPLVIVGGCLIGGSLISTYLKQADKKKQEFVTFKEETIKKIKEELKNVGDEAFNPEITDIFFKHTFYTVSSVVSSVIDEYSSDLNLMFKLIDTYSEMISEFSEELIAKIDEMEATL